MRTLALLALLLTSLAAADLPFKPPAAYACDMTATSGKERMTGRLIVGGPTMQRMEMRSDEGAVAIIMRADQKQMHMLMLDARMAMSMPLDPRRAPAGTQVVSDPTATWSKTGTETVNGVACDRYDWSNKDGKGTAWVDAKQSVLVRARSADGQADFTNYTIGAQAATLFEVPAGFQKMAMPGGQ